MASDAKKFVLDFEKPIVELEERLAAARERAGAGDEDAASEARDLARQIQQLQEEIYSHLSPWERVLLARHPDRPYTWDYVRLLFRNPIELHGDRLFRDDQAIICGFGWLGERRVLSLIHI